MSIFQAEHSTNRIYGAICWTGQDNAGKHWNVVEIAAPLLASGKAEIDALLIARLLNWYYLDWESAEQEMSPGEKR